MKTTLHYREQGTGPTVIFIHGFPMNLEVWNDFANNLSLSFHVVTVDLPGFGKSPSLQSGFSLEEVARKLSEWIQERKYRNPVVVGHSLGGYVTLALAALDVNPIAGMCLFHSTALPDSEEKKESRNKVLEFIEKQGVEAFTANFIGPLFANPQHAAVNDVKKIAVKSSKEAVRDYTVAMRDRKDQTGLIKTFQKPILFLAGEKDPGIPPDTIKKQADSNKLAESVILPGVAHMGMFESPGDCQEKIQKFVTRCLVTSKF
jgi:pimeloyl-ACP methyl ester carboxylesterase